MFHELSTLEMVLGHIKVAREQLDDLITYMDRLIKNLEAEIQKSRNVLDIPDKAAQIVACEELSKDGLDPLAGIFWSTEPESVIQQLNEKILGTMTTMFRQVGNGLMGLPTARIKAWAERKDD